MADIDLKISLAGLRSKHPSCIAYVYTTALQQVLKGRITMVGDNQDRDRQVLSIFGDLDLDKVAKFEPPVSATASMRHLFLQHLTNLSISNVVDLPAVHIGSLVADATESHSLPVMVAIEDCTSSIPWEALFALPDGALPRRLFVFRCAQRRTVVESDPLPESLNKARIVIGSFNKGGPEPNSQFNAVEAGLWAGGGAAPHWLNPVSPELPGTLPQPEDRSVHPERGWTDDLKWAAQARLAIHLYPISGTGSALPHPDFALKPGQLAPLLSTAAVAACALPVRWLTSRRSGAGLGSRLACDYVAAGWRVAVSAFAPFELSRSASIGRCATTALFDQQKRPTNVAEFGQALRQCADQSIPKMGSDIVIAAESPNTLLYPLPEHESFPLDAVLAGEINLGCRHEAINRFVIEHNGTWRERPYGVELFLEAPQGYTSGDMWQAAEEQGKKDQLDEIALGVIYKHLKAIADGQQCEHCRRTENFVHTVNVSKELLRAHNGRVLALLDPFVKLSLDVAFEVDESSDVHTDLPLWQRVVASLQELQIVLDDFHSPQASHMQDFCADATLIRHIRLVKLDWRYFQECPKQDVVSRRIVNAIEWALSQPFKWVVEGIENDDWRITLRRLCNAVQGPEKEIYIQGRDVKPV